MFARRDRFFEVPRTTRATSGGPVDLPILYYDASNVVALFRASRAGAEALLEGTGLRPQLGRDGQAMVALSFYEYRRTSVGVYNEVGTAILALPRDARQSPLGVAEMLAPARWRTSGAFVVDLPVTTALANAAGREIWGYPKFVTDISFRLSGRDVESVVYEPGSEASAQTRRRRIVALSGRMGPGLPAPPPGVTTYSVLQRTLMKTLIDVRGRVTMRAPGSVGLEIGQSAHPMARNLRTLGLGGLVDGGRSTPDLIIETDRFQSILPAGVAVTVEPARHADRSTERVERVERAERAE
jgi:hypothetical protein